MEKIIRKFKNIPTRRYEWPVTHMWYTKKSGMTIEEIIDSDPEFFMWMVETFQNVTPTQARYFYGKVGIRIPSEWIQDVEPYDHKPTDSDRLYSELCDTQDIIQVMKKYRGVQLNLF